MNAALLLVLVAALFALPLLPALLELMRPRDAAELAVPHAHDGRPDHFARTFRRIALGAAGSASPTGEPRRPPRIGQAPLHVAGDACADDDVYCAGWIDCADGAQVRAMLSDTAITLGTGTTVTRWLHADWISAGPHCRLAGRVTAESSIGLAAPASFARLHAPLIRFGATTPFVRPPRAELRAIDLQRLEHVVHWQPRIGRAVIGQALTIAPGSRLEGRLVVLGDVRIGAGCVVAGDLKAHGRIELDDDCRIEGTLVATDTVHVGRRCEVRGPVVGERSVHLSAGCRIGRDDWPSTVTAEAITVEPDVIVCGTAWARSHGSLLGA